MKQTKTIYQKFKQLISILWPILVAQITVFSMNFFDTIMAGHAGTSDLAGVAIGSSIWLPINAGLGGIFVAVTPIVVQLIGANNPKKIAYKVRQGLYLALTLSGLVIILGGLSLETILSSLDLEEDVYIISARYLSALAVGVPALFVYQVLRSFIDALGKTRITMMIAVLSLPINIALNYVLIFGKIGLTPLGGVGAGVASAITYWCMVLMGIAVVLFEKSIASYGVFKFVYGVSLKEWKEQLIIGLPIGLAIFIETSIFAVVTMLMSAFDTVTIAAHQVAMNFSTMLYMIPLSMSSALTILVGFETGARRIKDARQYAFLGIGVSVGMACLSALVLMFFRDWIAALYSKQLEVIQLAQQFLIYAIFFQLSDAISAPIQGTLRGYKDVNVTFFMAFVAYWVVGLPSGYYMANNTFIGAGGYWIGLIFGLAVSAVCLFIRLLIVLNQQKAEVAPEE